MISRICARLLLACGLWAASAVQAATVYEEFINGGTCIPYPQNFPYVNSYQHWLRASPPSPQYLSVYCHLTMSYDWPVNKLFWVYFSADLVKIDPTVGSNGLRARLCVHNGSSVTTCGSESIVWEGGTNNVLTLPIPMPPYASGAFVLFTFPPGYRGTIFDLRPLWWTN